MHAGLEVGTLGERGGAQSRPPGAAHAGRALVAVRLIKKELDDLGAGSRQVGALEEWLLLESEKHSHPEHQEPIEVSGKHTLT